MSGMAPNTDNTSRRGSSSSSSRPHSNQQGHTGPATNAEIHPRQISRSQHAALTVNTATTGTSPNPLPTPTTSPSTSRYPPASNGFAHLEHHISQSQPLNADPHNNYDPRLRYPDQWPLHGSRLTSESQSVSHHPLPQYQPHPQQSPHYHPQSDQNMPDSASVVQPVSIPPHIKARVENAMHRASPLVMSAWQSTKAEMEIAMAQMSAWYDAVLNAEIAKREGLERELNGSIQERDTGRKELQKLWDENQKLFQDAVQFESLNGNLQKRCTELDMDKKALRVFVDKLAGEKASLTQEIQRLQAERNAEVPDASDIAESVQNALTEQYRTSIASLLADAQEQRSLRLEAERKLAELERQLPCTPGRPAMPLQDHYPTPTSPSINYPQSLNIDHTANSATDGTAPSSSVKIEDCDSFQPIASSSHTQPAETSEQNIFTNNPSPPTLSTPKARGKQTRTSTSSEQETQRDPKRRRIDQTAQMKQSNDTSGNTGQSMDTSAQGAVDITSADLPAWQVKVEEPAANDDHDKSMEGDDIDELRDEDISRASEGMTRDAGPSTLRLIHVPSPPGPRSTNTDAPTCPPVRCSAKIHTSNLQYVFDEVENRLICMFCANHYTNANPRTIWPPVSSFPKGASVESLIAHLETSHASACASLAKMNETQMEEWKTRQVNLRLFGS